MLVLSNKLYMYQPMYQKRNPYT